MDTISGGGPLPKRAILIISLFSAFEALACFVWLLAIPGGGRGQLPLGLSPQRLALAAFLLLGAVSFLVFSIGLWTGKPGFVGLEKRLVRSSGFFRVYLILGSALTVVSVLGIFWLPARAPTLEPYLARLFPVFAWLGLLGLQAALLGWFLLAKSPSAIRIGLSAGILAWSSALLVWSCFRPADAGLSARFSFLEVLVPSFIVLLVLLPARGKAGRAALVAAFLILVGLPLVGFWASAGDDTNLLLGILPFNDAHGYYLGAERLLQGALMQPFAARRPLYPAFLAALLELTGGNLMAALAILALIVALSIFLFVRITRSAHGTPAAALAALVLFLFARRYLGETVTETLGFALGAVGLGLIWQGAVRRDLHPVYVGLAALSTGLNARAGPFFILPALVLWAGLAFNEKSRISWRIVVFASLAAAVGFAINGLVFRVSAPPGSVPFSNFSYSLYGTVTGGRGWARVFLDHPELKTLAEPELSRTIYQMTWQAFRERPLGLAQGALKAWASFFSTEWYGMFGFVRAANAAQEWVARWVLFGLSLVGAFAALARRREARSSLLLFAGMGVLVSVPFVPPLDAEIRTYAAVIPLFAMFAAGGLAVLLKLFRQASIALPVEDGSSPNSGLLFGMALIVFSLVGPLVVRLTAHPPAIPTGSCPAGMEMVLSRVSAGAYVSVLDDQSLSNTWLPAVRYADFEKSVHDFEFNEITMELAPLTPPVTLAFTYNIPDGRHVWLIADTRAMPSSPGLLRICGHWSPSLEKTGYGFFYAETITRVAD